MSQHFLIIGARPKPSARYWRLWLNREVVMKFEATFSEHGRVMTRTYDKQDATKEDVIEWFGLREHDIDWFTIKEINEKD